MNNIEKTNIFSINDNEIVDNETNKYKIADNKINIFSINDNEIDKNETNKCEIDDNIIIFKCPHCNIFITVAINELNCSIFRHGFNIKTNCQISPHESKGICDLYINNPDIVGCCKPFQIINKESNYYVIICDYI